MFEGKQYELDVLIYATGFEVQKTGIYNQIRGENGLELNDKYRDGMRTLVGIHSHGYPNLFIMGGYQSSFQFNLTDMLQSQGDHIAACIDYTRRHGYHTIDPRRDAEEWWVQEVIKHRGKTTPQSRLHAGLLQLRGRVPPASGRQLQRRLQSLLHPHGRGAGEDGREFRLHQRVGIQ